MPFWSTMSTVTVFLKAFFIKKLLHQVFAVKISKFKINWRFKVCTSTICLGIVHTKIKHFIWHKNINLLLKNFLKIVDTVQCSHTFNALKLTLICKTLGRNESIIEHGNNSLFTASNYPMRFFIQIFFNCYGGKQFILILIGLYSNYAHWKENTNSNWVKKVHQK